MPAAAAARHRPSRSAQSKAKKPLRPAMEQKPAPLVQCVHVKAGAALPEAAKLGVVVLGVVFLFRKGRKALCVVCAIQLAAVLPHRGGVAAVPAAEKQLFRTHGPGDAGHLAQSRRAGEQQGELLRAAGGRRLLFRRLHPIQKFQQRGGQIIVIPAQGPFVVEYVHCFAPFPFIPQALYLVFHLPLTNRPTKKALRQTQSMTMAIHTPTAPMPKLMPST